MSDTESVTDLQWAHETLVRLVSLVQRNGLMGERLSQCVIHMGTSAVMLEGLIQESLAHARRRAED